MPLTNARVFARLYSFSRPDAQTTAMARFVVEYILLDGARRSDKAELVLTNLDDETETHRALKVELDREEHGARPAGERGELERDAISLAARRAEKRERGEGRHATQPEPPPPARRTHGWIQARNAGAGKLRDS